MKHLFIQFNSLSRMNSTITNLIEKGLKIRRPECIIIPTGARSFPFSERLLMQNEKDTKKPEGTVISNAHSQDSAGKLAFENPTLCSQLLKDYSGLEILKGVKPEDIIDETERFLPMFTNERDADVVKRVKLSDGGSMFIISLIEHKSESDYNVSMQMLRYMTQIWEDYEKRAEKDHKGISGTKGFKYPAILPIVYYEGDRTWTPPRNFKERIDDYGEIAKFVPDWEYILVNIHGLTEDEILRKNNELALFMMVNRLRSSEDFKNLNLPDGFVRNIAQNAPADVLEVYVKVFSTLLRKISVPENNIVDFTNQIKERKMGELFANFKGYDWQATRAEGIEEGRKEGIGTGIDLMDELFSILIEKERYGDLKKATTDKDYQNELIKELFPEKWEQFFGEPVKSI